LPGRFAPELKRLCRQFELVLVHALVDHARDLHISAERYPAEAIFRFTDLLFKKGKPGIKKEIKFLYPAFEPFGGQIVSQLMQHYDDGK
jgi:hypothetical protein